MLRTCSRHCTLVVQPRAKGPLGRHRHRSQYNVKSMLKNTSIVCTETNETQYNLLTACCQRGSKTSVFMTGGEIPD
jgi:hypothetical protein